MGVMILHDLVWLFTPKVPTGTSRKLHNPWMGPWTIKEVLSEVLFRIETTGAWSRKPINIVTSIDRLQRYQVREGTTALNRLPLGQDYEPKDFDILDELLESPEDLPGPTKEFESRAYPAPDDFGNPLVDEDDHPRPPTPAIPQPRTSPRKVRHDWSRARGNLSPELGPSSKDDEDMGSNNEEDPADPAYVPSESPMESEGDSRETKSGNDEGSAMEPEEGPITPPSHRYPTRQRGFKRSLLELLNEPDYYVSPYSYPKSPQRKNPRSHQ